MKKLTKIVLVMALMTPTLSLAQSATNSVYIDQVGDGSVVTLAQSGQANKVGTENDRFKLEGNNQNLTFTQDGNGNSIQGSIKQADGINYSVTNTGDNNTVNFDVGSSASVAGSTLNLGVTGSSNEVNLTQGSVASSTGVTQNITITGDTNRYTATTNADDVTHTATVSGDSNIITTLQNGHAAKHLDMVLVGSQNNVTVNQTSTANIDSLSINSQSSGSTITVNQCNAGHC